MSGVKQTISKAGLIVVIILGATACSSLKLSRFAPPGIVKYEDIASEKPPNPAIQERIDQRKQSDKEAFPILARTPSAPPPEGDIEQRQESLAALIEARDVLQADIAADRAIAEQEMTERDMLSEQSVMLSDQLDRDTKAAKQERKAPLPEVEQQ